MSAIIIAKVAALLDRRLAVRILSVPLDKFVIVDRLKSQYLADLFTNISLMSAFAWRSQPVDATQALNLSAGVSYSNVFLGRPLS